MNDMERWFDLEDLATYQADKAEYLAWLASVPYEEIAEWCNREVDNLLTTGPDPV